MNSVTTPTRRTALRGGAALALGLVSAACSGGSKGGIGPDGRVTIQLWHGQNERNRVVVEELVADFERAYPNIRVDLGGGGVVADEMLQKVLAALASGSFPDIAYIFGSDLASIARSPNVVDLTDALPGWNDLWQPVQTAVTLNGRVRAAPALTDSLAVVCNQAVFANAGVALPVTGWSWKDFTATARKLTDADRGTFGTGWPGVGDEDTTWRLWPLVWDLGGEVIAADGKTVGFADVGERALQVVADLARDKSVYIDAKPGTDQMYQVFKSGLMGMVITGQWQLAEIIDAKVDYTVVPMPSFTGAPMTISGPDTWTLFDNGPARVHAARTFVNWLNDPRQDVRWDIGAGSLPLSRPAQALPEWQRQVEDIDGLDVFTRALAYSRARPVHPAYPQVSQALGQAIVSVLYGRRSPAEAMRRCRREADAALHIPR